jgi:hypothetical protein
MRASPRLSGAARRLVTAADTADVRISVMRRPSMTASGSPGIRPEEQDHGEMSGHRRAGIARVEAHELQTHRRLRHRGHDAQIPLVFLYGDHAPHGLNHAAPREHDERRLHLRDELIPAEDGPYGLLVQIHDRRTTLRGHAGR